MEPYLQPDFFKNCLADLCSIHLTIIGICLTIFTLLYSFIFSKRTEIANYSDALKTKNVDPLIAEKYGRTKRYIDDLSTIISKCKYAMISSIISWSICWIDKMFILPSLWKYGIFIAAIVISLCEIIFIGYWGWLIALQYHRDVKA